MNMRKRLPTSANLTPENANCGTISALRHTASVFAVSS